MTQAGFQFHISGPDAERTAQELSDFIEKEFGQRPTLKKAEGAADQVKVDPVAVAGLILAVPGAVMAVVNLVDRIKKKQSAVRLIELAREQHSKNPQVQIIVITPAGLAAPLHHADSAELLDAASRATGTHS